MINAKLSDTICAVATPPGRGGVGVVRISGPCAEEVAQRVFTSKNGTALRDAEHAKMLYGVMDCGGFTDNGLCVVFRAPQSFTGENVAELHCHGGPVILHALIGRLLTLGARMAENGEFSRRAFLNGKLDLTECEGLIDLIEAESEAQAAAAAALADGGLKRAAGGLQDAVRDALAAAEADIDDGGAYGNLHGADFVKEAESALKLCVRKLTVLKKSYQTGSLIREGVTVALCGKTNVGKSSLFNALYGDDRAIVTDIPGTTRDVIEGTFTHKGAVFILHDTAGLREGGDTVEKMGIARTKRTVAICDIALLVHDASAPADTADWAALRLSKGKKSLRVLSKADLLSLGKTQKAPAQAQGYDIAVSAVTGYHIAELKDLIYEKTIGKTYTGGLMLTNHRHFDAVQRALTLAKETLETLPTLYADMAAQQLMTLYATLGELTGETGLENIISAVFSRFCLGK